MKVTIAVPVYGVEKYVGKCVDSLFSQDYDDIEFLFINDCTFDNSVGEIHKSLQHYPHRIQQTKVVNLPENKGLSAVRNLAIQLATGDFIFHVDSDDYIEPGAISSLVAEQIATGADLVVANFSIETPDTKIIVKYCDISKTKEEIVKDCIGDKAGQAVWGILIRRQIYIDNHIKADESFSIGEDWQVSPLLLYYAKKIAYIDKVVYHYQLSRPDSITLSSQTSFSEKKKRFVCYVKTMNRLLDSFKDKGEKYIDTIYREKAILIQDAMIYSCKDRDKKTFYEMLYELKSIDSRYLSILGNPNPIVSSLKRNYYSLLILLWVKDLLRKNKEG